MITMPTPSNLHLEIQTHRKNHYGLIRSSFRLDGKVQHTNHGRISGLPLDKLKLLQAAFRGQVVPIDSPSAFQILSSREYGASHALLQLAKELELHQVLYSRNEPWVGPALAMIIGRIVYAGSKLALSHQTKNTALWELCGVEGKIDVDKHCYQVMDRLLERQPAIQRSLAKKHLQNGHLVLYDITSSYFEGEYPDSDIVTFGYNRDGKRGHEQMVIALLCNEEGCPVGAEVFPGNTQDAKTVPDKIAQIQQAYGINQLIFVGDRGMITQANSRKLEGIMGLQTISALTHRQIVDLLERKVITPELFDDKAIAEVLDPDNLKRRYCLCRNPQTAKRETQTRKELLEVTRQRLEAIAAPRKKPGQKNPDQKPTRKPTKKKIPPAEKIGARVGREVSCQTGQQSGAVPQTAAVFPLEIRFEDGQAVRLVLGFSQPLVAELDPQAGGASETSTRTNGEPGMAGAPMAASPKTLDLLMEVELPVSVSFGRSQLPLKDVLKLTTGSIVELNRSVAEPVEVIVNNCVIARGEVVVVEGNYGVRIRQIFSRQERLRNLN